MPNPAPCAPETPLAKKLGLLPAKLRPCSVALLGEPDEFRTSLGELPASVRFTPHTNPETTLAICFVRSLRELNGVLDLMSAQLPEAASFWIARPKQHHNPGFNENQVRDAGLDRGFVDYKICSFGNDWSGIKFTRRRTPAKAST